ncbi:MAG: hypothetical protein V1851_02535 [Patescibacteria group bacterium]
MDIELKITKKEIVVTVLMLVFSGVVFLALQTVLYFQLEYEKSMLDKTALVSMENPSKENLFKDLALSAKSYYILDLQTGETIAELNGEIQLPLASLTKLMTSLVASKINPEKTLVEIDENDLANEGDSGLVLGERWNLKDFLDFVLVTSSNDGARALASVQSAFAVDDENFNLDLASSFIDKMNTESKNLGMRQSYFLNESGLDVNANISGGYGSAKDMAILMETILREYPSLLEASSYGNLVLNSDIATHEISNTNIIVDRLPGVVASKTGYTDLAGGNLVMAFDLGMNHKIIISVLGSTKEERFSDVEKLIWASLKNEFNRDVQKLI